MKNYFIDTFKAIQDFIDELWPETAKEWVFAIWCWIITMWLIMDASHISDLYDIVTRLVLNQ